MRWTEINEARMAPLYHYMDYHKAIAVFRLDAMPAKWEHVIAGRRVKGNSFTRNVNYTFPRPVRLTMNQMALAARHKIIPLDGERTFRDTLHADALSSEQTTVRDRRMNAAVGVDKALQEEFVVGDIAPLSRTITKIEIVDPSGQNLLSGNDMITLVEVCKAYAEKHSIELTIHPEMLERIERVKAYWADPDY